MIITYILMGIITWLVSLGFLLHYHRKDDWSVKLVVAFIAILAGVLFPLTFILVGSILLFDFAGKDKTHGIHCDARQKEFAKYHELIYAVGMKYPNETRHETALRYIRQAEQSDTNSSMCKAQEEMK